MSTSEHDVVFNGNQLYALPDKNMYITTSTFNAVTKVHIRCFLTDTGNTIPPKRGITLSLEALEKIIDCFPHIKTDFVNLENKVKGATSTDPQAARLMENRMNAVLPSGRDDSLNTCQKRYSLKRSSDACSDPTYFWSPNSATKITKY